MALDPTAMAHEHPDAPAYERAILGALHEAVGFDAAFFAVLGARPTTVTLDAATLERAFATHAYDAELLPLKRAALERRGVAVDTSVLGEAEVRRRAYHRELAAPLGGRHSLMAYMALRGRPLGAVMLGRNGATFSDADVALVEAALPGITVGRASYHAPFAGAPLPDTAESSVVARALTWARGGRVRASVEREGRAVWIRDRDGYREMVAARDGAELVWSRAHLDDPRRSGWFYVDLFHLAAARARHRTRALFIGCGGAVGVRQFAEVYPGIAVDLVDVDPAVIDLARDWYGLGGIPQVSVHVGDGFDFVARAPAATWDVVVVDAFSERDIPRLMTGRAFFRHVRRALRAGGCMAFNTIGALEGAGAVRAVERAARAELEDVRLVPVLDPGEVYSPAAVRNVVVLGSAG